MFVLPVGPLIASNLGNDIDSSSLDDSSLKMSLQSAFDAAALELDSFLADLSCESSRQNPVATRDDDKNSFASEERRLHASEIVLRRALCLAEEVRESSEQNKVDNNNNNDADDDNNSFASEEQRLHASEVVLRRALECMHYCKDETDDSLPSLDCCPPPRESCTESFDSPENQVPLLQPVSPFGSPISACSSTDYKTEFAVAPLQAQSPASVSSSKTPLQAQSTASVSSSKTPKRQQRRAYGLRPCISTDAGTSMVHLVTPTKSHFEIVHTMADVLFGRYEYSLFPLLSKRQYKRTVQGTVSVVLASGIVVVDLTKDSSSHMILIRLLVPALMALIQANMPHRTDETYLAMLLLGTHTVLTYLCAR